MVSALNGGKILGVFTHFDLVNMSLPRSRQMDGKAGIHADHCPFMLSLASDNALAYCHIDS